MSMTIESLRKAYDAFSCKVTLEISIDPVRLFKHHDPEMRKHILDRAYIEEQFRRGLFRSPFGEDHILAESERQLESADEEVFVFLSNAEKFIINNEKAITADDNEMVQDIQKKLKILKEDKAKNENYTKINENHTKLLEKLARLQINGVGGTNSSASLELYMESDNKKERELKSLKEKIGETLKQYQVLEKHKQALEHQKHLVEQQMKNLHAALETAKAEIDKQIRQKVAIQEAKEYAEAELMDYNDLKNKFQQLLVERNRLESQSKALERQKEDVTKQKDGAVKRLNDAESLIRKSDELQKRVELTEQNCAIILRQKDEAYKQLDQARIKMSEADRKRASAEEGASRMSERMQLMQEELKTLREERQKNPKLIEELQKQLEIERKEKEELQRQKAELQLRSEKQAAKLKQFMQLLTQCDNDNLFGNTGGNIPEKVSTSLPQIKFEIVPKDAPLAVVPKTNQALLPLYQQQNQQQSASKLDVMPAVSTPIKAKDILFHNYNGAKEFDAWEEAKEVRDQTLIRLLNNENNDKQTLKDMEKRISNNGTKPYIKLLGPTVIYLMSLFNSLKNNSNVSTLEICNIDLQLVEINLLIDALNNNKTITTLKFKKVRCLISKDVEDAAVKVLIEGILNNRNITSLSFEFCDFDGKHVEMIVNTLKNNTTLEILNLNGNAIKNEDFTEFCNYFKSNDRNASLRTLILSQNKIEVNEEFFNNTIKPTILPNSRWTQLRNLDIHIVDYRLNLKIGEQLQQAIEQSKPLAPPQKSLQVETKTEPKPEELEKQIKTSKGVILLDNYHLKNVEKKIKQEIKENGDIDELDNNDQNKTAFNFKGASLDAAEYKQLLEDVSKSKTKPYIAFSGNTALQIDQLIGRLWNNKSILILEFSNMKITVKDLEDLRKALQNNNTLQTLILKNIDLNKESIHRIFQIISDNPSLTRLDLIGSSTKIKPEEFKEWNFGYQLRAALSSNSNLRELNITGMDFGKKEELLGLKEFINFDENCSLEVFSLADNNIDLSECAKEVSNSWYSKGPFWTRLKCFNLKGNKNSGEFEYYIKQNIETRQSNSYSGP